MAVKETIECDQCGTVRGPSNHWILVKTDDGTVNFAPWNDDYKEYDKHICGEACVSKLLSQKIAEWRA